MLAYQFMSRLFPRSFSAKVFFIAFLGTHLPLAATIALIVGREGGLARNLDILLPVIGATAAGTVLSLGGLWLMLRPLFAVERSLCALEERGEVHPLPAGYRDVVGRLMVRVNRLALRIDERLDEATRRADTDPLTGLLNRSGLRRHIPEPARGGVLFIDIDHFKQVNDRFGHDTGDRLLAEFAAIARRALRRNDVIARIGGEEFLAFLPGADLHTAEAVADRIRLTVEAGLGAGGQPVTVSIGVAVAEAVGLPLTLLSRRADRACYIAKQTGRNRVATASAVTAEPAAA